jgi:2-polyprenyl-6-methoxyphenol hydroxylase-like FAD-dependent oxidoreductase
MHDAIALANLLYALPSRTGEDVTKIFEEYKAERLPAVQISFKNSQLMSKFMEKGIIGAIMLYLMTHMPMWLWRLAVSLLF